MRRRSMTKAPPAAGDDFVNDMNAAEAEQGPDMQTVELIQGSLNGWPTARSTSTPATRRP